MCDHGFVERLMVGFEEYKRRVAHYDKRHDGRQSESGQLLCPEWYYDEHVDSCDYEVYQTYNHSHLCEFDP